MRATLRLHKWRYSPDESSSAGERSSAATRAATSAICSCRRFAQGKRRSALPASIEAPAAAINAIAVTAPVSPAPPCSTVSVMEAAAG